MAGRPGVVGATRAGEGAIEALGCMVGAQAEKIRVRNRNKIHTGLLSLLNRRPPGKYLALS